MSVLEKTAYYRHRRDEVPNQELAQELAVSKDRQAIAEIAAHLWDKQQNVRSDCLKVLYEVGSREPALIADYVDDFLKLLLHKNNRMVWGAMIALSTIADRCPHQIWKKVDDVTAAMTNGSVISQVWGVKTLSRVAAATGAYGDKLIPVLLGMLTTCIPRDVATHAESMLEAVDPAHRDDFVSIIQKRMKEMTPSQLRRTKRALKKLPSQST